MSKSSNPTTAEDDDLDSFLRQKAWQGKIPAKISLAANESKSFTNSPPLYVSTRYYETDGKIQLPRILYLPCFLETIMGFFRSELIEDKSDEELYREAWFSFEDAPLKWYIVDQGTAEFFQALAYWCSIRSAYGF